jgi:Outer membrane lipoprotein carrier protein LolA
MAALFKAGTGHKAAIAALLASSCLWLTAVPAWAENVPLPKPRPHTVVTGSIIQYPANRGISPQALAANAQAPQTPAPRAQAPNPIANPFAALLGKSGAAGALKPEQQAIISRVNNYLSNMQVLSGKFVQVGPDGGRTQGDFYISKPGKVRFEYDDPSPIELIADGQSVVVRDRHCRHQPLDDDVCRQGHAAQAMDRDRPAGLRHHRGGLQPRHQPPAGSRSVQDRLHVVSELILSGKIPAPTLAICAARHKLPACPSKSPPGISIPSACASIWWRSS